jgi:hypothetical protein
MPNEIPNDSTATAQSELEALLVQAFREQKAVLYVPPPLTGGAWTLKLVPMPEDIRPRDLRVVEGGNG